MALLDVLMSLAHYSRGGAGDGVMCRPEFEIPAPGTKVGPAAGPARGSGASEPALHRGSTAPPPGGRNGNEYFPSVVFVVTRSNRKFPSPEASGSLQNPTDVVAMMTVVTGSVERK